MKYPYLKISLGIAEALCQTQMSGYEHRCLWVILRKTYGYNKKEDWITLGQFEQYTGLKKPHISRTLQGLLDRKIITKNGKKYGLNKRFEQWIKKLPKMVINQDPKMVIGIPKIGNKVSPILVTTKEIRQYTKERGTEVQKKGNGELADLEKILEGSTDHFLLDKYSYPGETMNEFLKRIRNRVTKLKEV
jgi:phage replication O-like protein O